MRTSFLANSPFFSLWAFLLLAVTLNLSITRAPAQIGAEAEANDPLTTYQGKNRVVLVFAPMASDEKFSKQMSELQNKAELNDRQIVVLAVRGDDKAAGKSLPYLQKKFNGGGDAFAFVLIGKDGNNAFQSAEPVSAATIYEKIDAMPMRKEEVKEKSAEADKTRGESKTEEQKDN